MALLQPNPPSIGGFHMGYDYISPTVEPQHCFTLNDFVWDDYTSPAHWGGPPFEPLRPGVDRTPALYFGFDRNLPAGVIGLYLNIALDPNQTTGPDLNWQYWGGTAWSNLGAQDDSKALALPGVVSVAWPGNAATPFARFGASQTWLRASLKTDTSPLMSRVKGVYLNAVWAQNLQTVQNEALGSSNGQPNQAFFLKQTPVLGDASIQVRELDGTRAATEAAPFADNLIASGMSQSGIRLVTDVITGAVTEVWVNGKCPNLLLSGPADRDYTIERDTGHIVFGDNQDGMIPPAGQDNILALQYNYGGGLTGNVPAGAITQLLSGVTAQGVANPAPGEGGSAGESLTDVLTRGPKVLRHRYRALSREDYEDLAREASPSVAAARAFAAQQASGRPAPGWVTLVIVPLSTDPQPQPSFELCQEVRSYLAPRMPASVAGISIIGPTYLPVGVYVGFAPINIEASAPATATITATLTAFLQPLTGGPNGAGWPFGRGVYVSDIARVVNDIAGVDYIATLELLLNSVPSGDYAPVPGNQIVCAGPLNIVPVAGGN